MTDIQAEEHASYLLQELGLTEYEAKTFVALSMLPQATAKEVSNLVDIPRTRVYDSVGVLESKGLVEIQHASPQLFRAVADDEAISILRNEYEAHVSDLHRTLQSFDAVAPEELPDDTHEVWAFSGTEAVRERTRRLLVEASGHVVFVIDASLVDDSRLLNAAASAAERVDEFHIVVHDESDIPAVESAVPEAVVSVLESDWFSIDDPMAPDTTVRLLLLVDHRSVLTSTRMSTNGEPTDRAIYAAGTNNCFVTLMRRMLSSMQRPAER